MLKTTVLHIQNKNHEVSALQKTNTDWMTALQIDHVQFIGRLQSPVTLILCPICVLASVFSFLDCFNFAQRKCEEKYLIFHMGILPYLGQCMKCTISDRCPQMGLYLSVSVFLLFSLPSYLWSALNHRYSAFSPIPFWNWNHSCFVFIFQC